MATLDDVPADVTPPPPGGPAEAPPPATGANPPSAAPFSGEPEGQQAGAELLPTEGPEGPGLLSDCRLMLRYASVNAFVLAPELVRQTAWLDAVLKLKGISPISALTSALVADISAADASLGYVGGTASTPAAAGEAPRPLSPEEVVLRVHSDLSLLIAPTTALSLQTSEPPPGRMRIFGGMPRLVRTAIFIAVTSALIFVISAVNIKDPDAPSASAGSKDATGTPSTKKNPQVPSVKDPASAAVPIPSMASVPGSAASRPAGNPQAAPAASTPATDGGTK